MIFVRKYFSRILGQMPSSSPPPSPTPMETGVIALSILSCKTVSKWSAVYCSALVGVGWQIYGCSRSWSYADSFIVAPAAWQRSPPDGHIPLYRLPRDVRHKLVTSPLAQNSITHSITYIGLGHVWYQTRSVPNHFGTKKDVFGTTRLIRYLSISAPGDVQFGTSTVSVPGPIQYQVCFGTKLS